MALSRHGLRTPNVSHRVWQISFADASRWEKPRLEWRVSCFGAVEQSFYGTLWYHGSTMVLPGQRQLLVVAGDNYKWPVVWG
jgi:hypothetical protein